MAKEKRVLEDNDGLHEWIRDKFGADAQIAELDKGTTGFSNETWFMTVANVNEGESDERALVLRKPREEIQFFPSYDIGFQYEILRALTRTPTPAPNPVVLESDPRVPPFFERDSATGEIKSVDAEAVRRAERFGDALRNSK